MTSPDAPPRIAYTVPEAAPLLGMSQQKLRRLIRADLIRAVRPAGRQRYVIPTAAIREFLDDDQKAAS